MLRQSLIGAAIALSLSATAAIGAPPSPMDREIDQRAASLEADMIAWRRDIHEHPELANQEVRTSAIVVKHLRSLGYEVRGGLAGGTGVIGLLKGGRPGPVVAIRADMDALPLKELTDVPFASKVTAKWGGASSPVMHACGHDAHVAVLMAAAKVFADMKSELPGTVMLIFQPAEESAPPDWKGPTGAELMRDEGDLSHPKPDVIYGMHLNAGMRGNAGELIVGKGALSYGLSQFRITIQGKGAHAARPWEGNDTVVTAAQTIMALQTIPSREVNIYKNDVTLSIGAIGGAVTFNVLPEAVTLDGALRYTDDSQRTHLEGRILEVAQGVAASASETAKIDWIVRDPPILNDPALADAARASLLKAVSDPAKVVDYDVGKSVGVDDFSMFNAVAPTFFLLVGASRDQNDPAPVTGHHSPQFYVNETALLPALRAELHMAVDYMTAHATP